MQWFNHHSLYDSDVSAVESHKIWKTLVLWKVKKIRQLFPYMDLKDYMIMLFYHNDADGTDLEL